MLLYTVYIFQIGRGNVTVRADIRGYIHKNWPIQNLIQNASAFRVFACIRTCSTSQDVITLTIQ